jgi:GDP/UDP-N,N'-diacetylbacillosamine 2-epimerase (hydrolysing)
MMRVGILTSSRADFGIYLPLLKQLKQDSDFELSLIAFGTHLSDFHGKTIHQIERLGFEVEYTVESMQLTDSPNAIATAIGLTTIKFADFWKAHAQDFDLIFCLGDRYEMFAAVMAAVPFQLPIAHLHGGETTLGAIDNAFRHAITVASTYHFVSTESHAQRVAEIIGSKEHIYNVGALSLDNIQDIPMLTIEAFKEKLGIDLAIPTILITFHPETVALTKNEGYTNELVKAIKQLTDYQVLITMPNADTSGNTVRQILLANFSNDKRVLLVENLGTQNYLTVMKYATVLVGNTSSGIIEAASFAKPVINLGNRQLGRTAGNNVIHVPISSDAIVAAVAHADTLTLDSTNPILEWWRYCKNY